MGNNTRVLVGPEHKQAQARALASRLQNELHIQGMVVSYKPLTL
jgi:cell division septation protein DedD